jgi:hypothetical protein
MGWRGGESPLFYYKNFLCGYLLEMHILRVSASPQTITIIPRQFVYSQEDLDLYFERVLLDDGTLEGTACVVSALNDLDGVSLYITDESTNTTAEINPTIEEANGFMYLTSTFSLVDGRFYGMKLIYDGNLIYRDRIYVTSQTEYDKFTVNSGVYTEETTYNNEYIII